MPVKKKAKSKTKKKTTVRKKTAKKSKTCKTCKKPIKKGCVCGKEMGTGGR
jgi:hypothetical protein